MFNKIIKKSLILVPLLTTSHFSFAEYPEKKIEVIVGYPAGGGTDVMARTVAPFVEKYLGEGASLIIKNVPGASGQIGIIQTAGAKADGYTIGTYNLPGMMARTLDREAGYDASSFTFIANVVNDPNVIATPKDSEIKDMETLIKMAKSDPGYITVGMSSLGGDDQFLTIQLSKLAEVELTIIPFKGSAPTRTALMGGHIKIGVLNLSEVLTFKDELNIIAVATEEMSSLAEDIPTFIELGFPLVSGSRRGFVGPAGIPDDIVSKLITAFEKAYADEEFQKLMISTGNPLELKTGDDFKEINKEEYESAKEVWEKAPWK